VFYVRGNHGAKCLAELFPQFRGWGEAPASFRVSVEAILSSQGPARRSSLRRMKFLPVGAALVTLYRS